MGVELEEVDWAAEDLSFTGLTPQLWGRLALSTQGLIPRLYSST